MAGRHYPAQWLEELRQRADIVQIVGSYISLKKNGHRYVGLCPFHHETAPSFGVNADLQLYYCFGCKAGGNVFRFIMEMEKLDFPDAVQYLAEQLHVPLPEMENDPQYEMRRTLKERLYEANKEAARIYHQQLWTPEGKQILNYLQEKRGLSDAVIKRFGIGAALPSGRLGAKLKEMGFSQDELVQGGLLRKDDKGSVWDMFRNRPVFPIIDSYGNILGFGGRAMDDRPPKYLNTMDTPVFNKRFNVFGANILRKERNLSRVILVEGYMDVVSLTQYGVIGVAATLGTALTVEQAKLLKRFAPEVYLCYDGDGAGQKAILRGLDIMEEAEVPCRVLDLPGGQDPDEYIREHGVEAFEAIEPISGTQYRMLREKDRFDLSTEEGRTNYAMACAAHIRKVKQPVEAENHLKRLALETGYSIDVLRAQMGSVTIVQKEAQGIVRRSSFHSRQEEQADDRAQELLLFLLASGKLPANEISAEWFDEGLLRQFAQSLIDGESPAAFIDSLSDAQSIATIARIVGNTDEEEDDTMMNMAQEALQKLKTEQLLHRQIDTVDETLSLEEAARMFKKLQTLKDPLDKQKE